MSDPDAAATDLAEAALDTIRRTLEVDAANLAFDVTVRPAAVVVPAESSRSKEPKRFPRISLGRADLPDGPRAAHELDDIVVTGLLGQGGMGRVLLGQQRSLDREVAIKTAHDAASSAATAALLAEGALTGHLEHPNIVPVHQLGLDADGHPLIVMKRVVGVAWCDLLEDADHPAWQRIPTLPSDRLSAHIAILVQVTQALAFAHSRGVVHRDIKPENVMVGEHGEVYLVDWGIAARLDALPPGPRALAGTFCFAAPEMVDQSLALGPWTDVYLLGATLHCILTGAPPHQGANLQTMLRAVYNSAPADYPPSIPEELAALCRHSMRRDPKTRLGSALAFRTALVDYAAHAGSLLLTKEADERLTKLVELRNSPGSDPTVVARLATECRFGHLLALREWKENARAKGGLRRSLEVMTEIELERQNVAAVRALLAELEELAPRPEERSTLSRLTRELETLEALVSRREDEAKRLGVLEEDRDLRIGARQRTILFSAILLISLSLVGTTFVVHWITSSPRLTPTRSSFVLTACAMLVVVATGVVLGRRHLLQNAASRTIVGAFMGGVALIAIDRLLGFLAGASVADMARADMLIMAASMWAGSLQTSRVWIVGAVAMLVGATVATFDPEMAAPSFGFGMSAALVVSGLGLRAARKP